MSLNFGNIESYLTNLKNMLRQSPNPLDETSKGGLKFYFDKKANTGSLSLQELQTYKGTLTDVFEHITNLGKAYDDFVKAKTSLTKTDNDYYEYEEVLKDIDDQNIAESNFGKMMLNMSSSGDIVFPSGYTSIREYCLAYLKNISSIIIPEGYLTIGHRAFFNLNANTGSENNKCYVYLPASLSSIGSGTSNSFQNSKYLVPILAEGFSCNLDVRVITTLTEDEIKSMFEACDKTFNGTFTFNSFYREIVDDLIFDGYLDDENGIRKWSIAYA